MGRKSANRPRSNCGDQSFLLRLADCHKRDLLGMTLLGTTLLNTFINDLKGVIENTFNKFTDDSKLSGEVDMSEGSDILQRPVDRLEEWASENSMKVIKGLENLTYGERLKA